MLNNKCSKISTFLRKSFKRWSHPAPAFFPLDCCLQNLWNELRSYKNLEEDWVYMLSYSCCLRIRTQEQSFVCMFVCTSLTSVCTVRPNRQSATVWGPHRHTDSGSLAVPILLWRFTHPSTLSEVMKKHVKSNMWATFVEWSNFNLMNISIARTKEMLIERV